MSNAQPVALCLHGWGSRPEVFEVQLRTLVKPLRDLGYQVKFARAPCPLWIGKLDVVRTFGGPYFGWYQKETWQNIKHAILAVHEQQDLRQIDAIVGFSQGATLGLIIASLLEHGALEDILPGESKKSPNTNHAPSFKSLAEDFAGRDGEAFKAMSTGPFPCFPGSATASTVMSAATSGDRFSDTSSVSSRTSLGSNSDGSDATLCARCQGHHMHRVRFIIALCPIHTYWTPANIDYLDRKEECASKDWLPTIPTFFSVGELDRYKKQSEDVAAAASCGGDKHRIERFDFGHEVPRSVEASRQLLDFVKRYTPSAAPSTKTKLASRFEALYT